MRLREALADRRVLVTGVTGFIGEALLRTLLVEAPQTRPVVLVRPKAGQPAADRVARLLRRRTFAPAAEAAGGPERLLERVEVVEGDLEDVPALPRDLDVVVHCAGEVGFAPPLQEAFAVNVVGTRHLLERVLEASAPGPDREGRGPVHYVHVSTAYVGGRRRGPVPEASVEHAVDWRAELDAAVRLAARIEEDSRTPEVLARFNAEAQALHGRAGPLTAAADAERRRREWVLAEQREAGRQRGHSLGWTDVYTFTKALGERVVEEVGAPLPVSVVRPSIVESALEHPHPGWIEGFKMAEPLIMAYGRGELPEVPAAPDSTIDIVPVDHVVNALVAVCATTPEPGSPQYFHVSSGARNPLTFRRLYELVREHFLAHPFDTGEGPVDLPVWDFPGAAPVERRLALGERVHATAERALTYVPRSERVRGWSRDLDRLGRRLALLRQYSDLYQPYTQSELHFVDDATLALHRALDPQDVPALGFDTAVVDWPHYIRDVHAPSVTKPVRKQDELRRMRARRGPAGVRRPLVPAEPGAEPSDVLAVFDLDGTLLTANVVETYLWTRLPGLGTAGQAREVLSLARSLPSMLLTERRDRGDFLRQVYRRYRGADLRLLDELADTVLAPALLERASDAALQRVAAHRAAGHRTVLLSGAVEQLARPLAPMFDEVVTARLAVDADGRATGHLTAPPLVGEGRAAWVVRYAEVHGFDLAKSYAYADSHSDLPLLRAVGLPTAVSPDVPLLRAARGAGWPVEVWAARTTLPRRLRTPRAVTA
ncbi:HAD-IB family hydrolase [Pseudokineococcus marinus]|uniref:HAD-IB family hydrolase n=1 Tax=Pseudokineococcus marinus TaxID=351215 RepID=A0A849BRL4_9ACTN|nr:HAD-IB family hydrolase [Pseudokineococcus marinus]NNH24165.1 HAD-IB family hydrolase [Pseudokineococcus marinus]